MLKRVNNSISNLSVFIFTFVMRPSDQHNHLSYAMLHKSNKRRHYRYCFCKMIIIEILTLVVLKLSGSLKDRHCACSLISVSFQIFDLSSDSSVTLDFTSITLPVSPFWEN